MTLGDYYSNEQIKQFAETVLGETDENRTESIEKVRKWIQKNPKLHAKTDDNSILAFLRGCKFNLEITQQKITNFYTMKTERPEWFQDRDPTLPTIKELANIGVFIPLKKYHDNKLVVIIRTAAHDPKKHKQDDVFKAGKMILDVAIKENFENATIYGISAIFDMKNISLGHARQLPPHVIKKAVFAWQNYYCRPKQLEFVNAPLYINVVLNIFKSFMSEKLQGRVRVHFSGVDSLHEVISKDILPVEYGGNDGSTQELIEYWSQKLDDHKDWFKEDEEYKADLSD
ncbi:hypothetical protein ILUMI_04148 [Ignelater luminosus]|uniref:CRAL-TRIO domain-containing protein n=1 Tax=Ignelater luminosus TaxID=2038154 RepID=A0A8K0DA87_IGNLU|nr:hypothetical protein ILUMI_04148 [Ignelater luminosus]